MNPFTAPNRKLDRMTWSAVSRVYQVGRYERDPWFQLPLNARQHDQHGVKLRKSRRDLNPSFK